MTAPRKEFQPLVPGKSLEGDWAVCQIPTNIEVGQNVAIDSSATSPEKRMRKVCILATPLMRGALDQLGFVRDDWNFPLVVERLDDSISAAAVAPDKWYVAAND